MVLHADPGLAEVAGFDKEQLASLARSVEARRQQLEQDVCAYIQRKQAELRDYEQQLLDHYRPHDAGAKSETAAAAKKTKHTRVHKRERELFTFLPLLDALATSPPTAQREKKARPHPAPRHGDAANDHATPTTTTAAAHMSTKARRAPACKSALRSTGTPRPRRKRVSLAIDDQIVLPADSVVDPALASPSETTSTSNSTASLDDCIDPRLTHADAQPAATVDASPSASASASATVHHSLPLAVTHHNASPPKAATTLPSAPMSLDADPPPLLPLRAPYDFTPARTEKLRQDDVSATPPSIPEEEEDDQSFSTYVGGISGSGASDVNQTGSYGYPSSLGASYLESYMMSRPLSVRMAAAEKAELGQEEKRVMLERKEEEDDEAGLDMESAPRGAAADDDDFMGSMDDF